MTVDKDYAREDDQQVPDSTFDILTKDSGGTVFQQKVVQGIPDFDTLLTDLAAVGALDIPPTNTFADSESSPFDASQDTMELVYTERSFYDDYGTVHIKKEPCVDSKSMEFALMKTAAAPAQQQTVAPQQAHSNHDNNMQTYGSLGLLHDESSYNYSYQTVSRATQGTAGPAETLETQGITEDLSLAAEEPYESDYETIQKIDRASVELGISKNPYQWAPEHSHRWAEWTLKLYNLPLSYVMDFYMDGTIMCMLSLEDFQKRCPQYGDYLFAELDLWKSAYSFISSPLHGMSEASSASSDEEERSYTNLDDLSNSPQSYASLTGQNNPHLSSTLSSQAPPPSTLSSIPTPVIMSPVSHMSIAPATSSSTSYSAFSGSLQREPTLLQAAQGHRMMMNPVGGVSRGVSSRAVGGACVSPAPSLGSQGSSGHDSWSSSPNALQQDDRQEDMTALLADSTCEPPPHMGRGKHAIHLWQFLKELLLQPHAYHNCIRWLDRSKGIFKIEDSTRVAKLWGQRKNRPAMNYDKLSRSIRQYYKKGIIKKTENSKRLVYQFQPQYR